MIETREIEKPHAKKKLKIKNKSDVATFMQMVIRQHYIQYKIQKNYVLFSLITKIYIIFYYYSQTIFKQIPIFINILAYVFI